MRKLSWKDAMCSYDTADAVAVSAVGADMLGMIHLRRLVDECLLVEGKTAAIQTCSARLMT